MGKHDLKRQDKPKTRYIRGHKRSREPIDYGVTKDQFFAVLEKVSQPIKNSESETETTQTSESHPSDDCSERHTH